MTFEVRDEVLHDTGEPIQVFSIKTRKGYAYGFVHDNKLCIHHIGTNKGYKNPVKGIMNQLCRRFKTTQFRFLMVINPELKNIIQGRVVKIPADAEDNPFGEELEEIHGEWKL